jgi:hypothetical protein
VDEAILNAAIAKWGGKLSPLVENLLRAYIE